MNKLICNVYEYIGFLHANVLTDNVLTDVNFVHKREQALILLKYVKK
jgi:hypothetical protein